MIAATRLVLLLGITAAPDREVTYTKDVAPILLKNCAGCHRPGEIGPFSLLTYRDAAKRADDITNVTADRTMPPWKPVAGVGEFFGERRLSDAEIATLGAWVKGGSKEGSPADLPPPPSFPEGWQLGEPDLVLKMPEPFKLHASGGDVYQCFVLPSGLLEDRTIAAIEFRPGNPRIVHHGLFYTDTNGRARKLDAADPAPGYTHFGGVGFAPTGSLGGWVPGTTPRLLSDGLGRLLPKGSDVVIQVHYHPDGKPETDQSTIGFHFTKKPATRLVTMLMMNKFDLVIPAGDARHKVTDQFTLPADITLVAIGPHMHLLGREMKVTATLPDGRTRPLIWINDWDFNWQGAYQFRDAVALPKGTRIDIEAHYDNTSDNPSNPRNPPLEVRYGEQTTDEMCLCSLHFYADTPEDYKAVERALYSRARRSRSRPSQ